MPFKNVIENPYFWKTYFSPYRFSYDEIPDLRGKVAIVTGGTGGLGYATVVALAAHGAHVFIASRSEVRAQEAIERAQADILQLQFDFPDAIHSMRFDGPGGDPDLEGFDSGDEEFIIEYDEKTGHGASSPYGGQQRRRRPQGRPMGGRYSPQIEFLFLDLSNLHKTRAAATEFLSRDLPLHILVNNAGVRIRDFDTSDDGYEQHFAVNHLGHFVFTNCLLDRIKESQPSRIVVLTSMAHELPPSNRPIEFKHLRDTVNTLKMSNLQRFGQSKMACLLFAKALARRLRNDRVYVNAVHPGTVDSHIHQVIRESDSTQFQNFCRYWWMMFAYKARDAALTQLYCATSPEVELKNLRGQYFIPIANLLRPSPISEDVDLQERLWEYSERAAQGDNKV